MKLNVGYLEFHVRVGDSDCRIVVHVDEINAICEAPKHDSPYAKARTHLFTNGSDEPYALTDQYETVVERCMNEKDRLAKPGKEYGE